MLNIHYRICQKGSSESYYVSYDGSYDRSGGKSNDGDSISDKNDLGNDSNVSVSDSNVSDGNTSDDNTYMSLSNFEL